MGLEAATYVGDLVSSNPLASDQQLQGDDHLRLLKTVLQTTLPNASKSFRFQNDVAAKTGNYTIVFPDDQNKIIPVAPSSGDITISLPSPTGVNANGWSCIVLKSNNNANNVVISGTINEVTNYTLRGTYEGVKLVWVDSLTAWVALPLHRPFPKDTYLLFQQTTPPVGWTKVTTASYDNAAMRIVTGSVGTGGSTGFTSVFTSRTIAQANLPNVTLSYSGNTGGESHDHTHSYNDASNPGSVGTTGGGGIAETVSDTVRTTGGRSTGHTHAYSGNTSALGSGTAMDFAVKYVDSIVAYRTE